MMEYIIGNDSIGKYLVQTLTGFSLSDNKTDATRWSKKTKIDNVFHNVKNSKKWSKYCLKIHYVSDDKPIEDKNGSTLEVKKVCVQTQNQDLLNGKDDVLNKITEIVQYVKEIEKRKDNLLYEIKKVEKEICDIEHAIEFKTLNVVDGYKMYKLLHDARIKRRCYKNELEKIVLVIGTSMKVDCLEKLQQSISNVDNKKYRPRINEELFSI